MEFIGDFCESIDEGWGMLASNFWVIWCEIG